MESSKGFGPKRRPKIVPRCQKCNADRRKVIIVRNGVGHVTDLELDVSGVLSQCPSGDPAQQVQSSYDVSHEKNGSMMGWCRNSGSSSIQ